MNSWKIIVVATIQSLPLLVGLFQTDRQTSKNGLSKDMNIFPWNKEEVNLEFKLLNFGVSFKNINLVLILKTKL